MKELNTLVDNIINFNSI